MEKIKKYDVFNVGVGKDYSINEILKTILEIDDFKDAEIIFDKTKPTSIDKRTIDFSKIKKELSFKPKTTLKDGITKMINWYRPVSYTHLTLPTN